MLISNDTGNSSPLPNPQNSLAPPPPHHYLTNHRRHGRSWLRRRPAPRPPNNLYNISVVRGLFLEAFVTSMLILMILMLEGGTGKPMYVGLTLFIAELCSVFYTGGSLNPARSFGPSVVVGFERYHWIYWIGPCLGAAVASGAFWLINWVRHEKVESVERDD
jgi:glycerol uptake facilitator-like aquaporin